MNKNDLEHLFVKYLDVVESRYKELTSSRANYVNSDEPQRDDFEKVLQSSMDFVNNEIRSSGRTENGYRYRFPDFYFYFGEEGWDRYGIFSFISLYKRTKWSVDIVEKYKDSIVWPMLFEYGDFQFNEELLCKYDQYIPWIDKSQGVGKFVPFFDNGITVKRGTTLSNFKNVGKLSYSFIKSHISIIDIWGLCTTGCFVLTKEIIKLFKANCEMNLIYDYRCSHGGLAFNNRITISSGLLLYIAKELKLDSWEYLLPKVKFTSKVLRELYLYDSQRLEMLFNVDFNKRREIISLIKQNKELQQIVSTDFIKKLWQGGTIQEVFLSFLEKQEWWYADQEYCDKHGFEGLKDLPYTYDFSKSLIKKNRSRWNKTSFEYFDHMQRTPDTNYHYYKKVTTWDMLSKQETILLTYDLCKYLKSINVAIGGTYVLEDGHYYSHAMSSNNTTINGLILFRNINILNNEEYEKIINDADIVEFLLANADPPKWGQKYYIVGTIIDKLITIFFKRRSFDRFKDKLKSRII